MRPHEGQKRTVRTFISMMTMAAGTANSSSPGDLSLSQMNHTNRTGATTAKHLQSQVLVRACQGPKIRTALKKPSTIHVPMKYGATAWRKTPDTDYFPLNASFTWPLALPKSIWPA